MADPKRLLVMDDEPLVLEIVVAFGKRLGFDVVRVDNGNSAVGAYRQANEQVQPFDLVILDLSVPNGMGGVDAAHEILTIEPNAKLILSSGDPSNEICTEFVSNGFAGAICKPFTMEGFRECVEGVLGHSLD